MQLRLKVVHGLVVFIGVLFLNISRSVQAQDFDRQRDEMITKQIQQRGIKDTSVLAAMRKVKRHLFVPSRYKPLAYTDGPLPIGMGQTISQPYIVALMTELLHLKGNEKVLEIGTGSGYQAAILAELAKEVYSIEILEPLARQAEKLLTELGHRNIYVKAGDGFLGWPEQAPFDAIIVTCAPEEIPGPLIDQLSEGGRLVIPVGVDAQNLKLVRKIEGKLITMDIIPVRFVPMLKGGENKGSRETELEAQEGNLKRHVRVLTRHIGERNFSQYQNLERAADYIKQEFKKFGYGPQEQVYTLEGKTFRNIIATKKGKTSEEKIIIICAHYDSVVGSPGGDDNASGIAGLLELARILSQEELNRTIKFIAFTNEEPPFFMTRDMGSLRYAQEAKKKEEDILGVLCLESIGYYSDKKGSQSYPLGFRFFYPDKGNFIALVSNFGSADFLRKIVRGFRKQSNFPIQFLTAPMFLAPAISFSDHWSFWKFGYKAVMITDTAFYRNPSYHTSADTYEKLDYASMSEVVTGLCAVTKTLLNE
ncbi:MAG: protein-L-isoaspartate(D-aspartate) O-methyltransferase [Candidatus Omnitrophota bacterium]